MSLPPPPTPAVPVYPTPEAAAASGKKSEVIANKPETTSVPSSVEGREDKVVREAKSNDSNASASLDTGERGQHALNKKRKRKEGEKSLESLSVWLNNAIAASERKVRTRLDAMQRDVDSRIEDIRRKMQRSAAGLTATEHAFRNVVSEIEKDYSQRLPQFLACVERIIEDKQKQQPSLSAAHATRPISKEQHLRT
eukprot:jgi/Bigna1/74532/fgenesh1_pg.29_\